MPRSAAVLLWLALLPGVLPAQTPAAPPAPAATGAAGLSAERLERLGEVLETYIAGGRLPGAVVLVARHGRVAYLEAFGWRDREAREALETDDIFRIASQTKALVSTAVLMLQEEGRLLISHPVARYRARGLPPGARGAGGPLPPAREDARRPRVL